MCHDISHDFQDNLHIQTILDSVADGIFTVDRNFIIKSFNRAAERIIGVSREQAIGQKCYDVFHANICQNNCALKHTINTGQEIIDLHINVLNHKGDQIPISISTAILTDQTGRLIGGVETFRDLSALEELRKELSRQYSFQDIISKNHTMQEIFSILPDIADSDATVLIEGPSGSGKELMAKAIHNLSPRRDKPLIAVNCGALPDTLLESELFGYVRGAFTDAKKNKPGRFAQAEKGTIFLDEVGELSPAFQVKLLRVLQEREYVPLGATTPVKTDVRIIAATNRNLLEMVQQKTFRQDLYYRLNILRIKLPSLNERREDIPLLVEHFLRKLNLKKDKRISQVSGEVLQFLLSYSFPGNIRELENILEHAFILCRGNQIELEHLPKEVVQGNSSDIFNYKNNQAQTSPNRPIINQTRQESEIALISRTLEQFQGHRGKTAQALGINKSTLWRKMKRYGLL
ncbi:MAG: sigma 54-interacting transcriptional regulator [Syntrophomonadaceae bacterium]|nr:sigma 54-interacting transcriptional regulator [Syntrophomonadaceae bacterium]